jgi:hypothetical protein
LLGVSVVLSGTWVVQASIVTEVEVCLKDKKNRNLCMVSQENMSSTRSMSTCHPLLAPKMLKAQCKQRLLACLPNGSWTFNVGEEFPN